VSLRVEFHELVDNDLATAWGWYEDLQGGLGDRFLDAIDAAILRASRFPYSGSPVLRDEHDKIVERKVPTHGFPYAVRYRVAHDRLVVMAVLHQHRHPDVGTDRQR
jgi:plasmid stabilization system protein ParE